MIRRISLALTFLSQALGQWHMAPFFNAYHIVLNIELKSQQWLEFQESIKEV